LLNTKGYEKRSIVVKAVINVKNRGYTKNFSVRRHSERPFYTIIPVPANIPTAVPQLNTLHRRDDSPLLTLPVGLLGKSCVVDVAEAMTAVPRSASTTVVVELMDQFCLLNGGGPQYVELALEESEDST
jgi:hypothetical protein